MSADIRSRDVSALTFEDVSEALSRSSTLCLPLGSMEQHGPHLPLNTDTVIAETLTGRIVDRWGSSYDLWRLPAVPLGLSWEHAWAAGTMSFSVSTMAAILRDCVRQIARAFPTRNIIFVNGHGGNRGILDALMPELSNEFDLNMCALHLGALMSLVPETGLPNIHGGRDETSVMLAVAPDLVRMDRLNRLTAPPDADSVRALILDPGVSWPWSSGDQRIADRGVIGDAQSASPEHGEKIIEEIVNAAEGVLKRMMENEKLPRTRRV